MGRFSKHLGTGEEIEIGGEKYLIKPLTTDAIPDFLIAMKAFSGAKEGATVAEIFSGITPDTLPAIKKLVDETLKVSFPEEWKTDQHELRTFGMKYMMILLPKILEINSAQDDNSHESIKKERIMERLNSVQSTQ